MLPEVVPVEPHFGLVVDAVEVQPDLLPGVGMRDGERRAIPVGRAAQAVGNFVGPVVLAVQRLGVDAVVDQAGQHRSGDGGLVPGGGLVAGREMAAPLAATLAASWSCQPVFKESGSARAGRAERVKRAAILIHTGRRRRAGNNFIG